MSYAEEHYGWADETDYQHSARKETKMSVQQITVGAATKEPKNFGDETIWGVKVGNSWMDLHTPNKPARGAVLTVETWSVEGKNGKSYVHARPVAGQQPAQPPAAAPAQQQTRSAPVQSTNSNRTTPYTHSFEDYAAVARKVKPLAMELFADIPGDQVGAQERFTVAFMIAFGDGKLALPVEDEWGDVPSSTGPVKYEKCTAHDHLNKTIWNYFERIGGTADDALAMLKEVSGKADVLELSEKEAIQARLKVEKIIDEKTDYKALLTEAVKADFKKRGLDFASKDAAITEKKRSLLASLGMTGPYKDWTNMQAKAGLEKFNDPDHISY